MAPSRARRRGARQQSRGRPWRERAILFALATFVAGAAVSGAVAREVSDRQRADAEADFADRLGVATATIDGEIRRHVTKLRDVGAFWANAPEAGPAAGTGYVRSADLFEELPALGGLIYLERVEAADEPAFLERMRAHVPGFAVIDLGPRPPGATRFVLTAYVPGAVDHKVPAGPDARSIGSFGAFVERAIDGDRSVAGSFRTDPLLKSLPVLNGPEPMRILDAPFFFMVPVFTVDPASGRRAPAGAVAAPVVDFARLVPAGSDALRGLGLRLTVDLETVGLDRPEIEQVARDDVTAGPLEQAGRAGERTFTVEGVTWHLTAWSAPGPTAVTNVLVPFLLGVVAAGLLAAVVFLRLRSNARLAALARERADRVRFQEEVLQSASDPMVVLGPHGEMVVANRRWHALFGTDLAGRSYLEALRARALDEVGAIERLMELLADGTDSDVAELEVPILLDAHERWLSIKATRLGGSIGGAIVSHRDVTHYHRAQSELKELARHDPLTGLANRSALTSAFASPDEDGPTVVLFIDLDGFKPVNDRFGHQVGDALLVEAADRLTAAVRPSDLVARLGGDEFVVLARAADAGAAERIAQRIVDRIGEPFDLDGAAPAVGASVGIARVGDDDLPATLARADAAMYEAKRAGGSTFAWADADRAGV